MLKNAVILSNNLSQVCEEELDQFKLCIENFPNLTLFQYNWNEIVFLLSFMENFMPQVASTHSVCSNLIDTILMYF